VAGGSHGRASVAADTWVEIKSPNFTTWAQANDGATKTLVWQMEQMRSLATVLWPWMNTDSAKPIVLLAVKDEQGMRSVAPQYWETKGGIRPASVWVTAPDRHYIAIRTDVRSRDDVLVNPHMTAYFSYAHLLFTHSFKHSPPPWLSRGVSGVLSNTIVRQDDVLVGAAIPWHLERLREHRVPLRQIISTDAKGENLRNEQGQRDFDAQSWAFVHYLMFSENGAHAARLNAFVEAIDKGEPSASAFASAIGDIEKYDGAFTAYINRSLYAAARFKVDAGVDRERLPARPMRSAETAVAKASFHVALRRTADARALIDEAVKADPTSAAAVGLEALLLDQSGNADAAKPAYERAVDLGSTDPYILYRAAMLNRRDPAALERVEAQFARAIELNPRFADAHAAVAEVRAELRRPQAVIVPHMQKAVALEPSNPWHRIIAARILWRLGAADEARKALDGALARADSDARAKQEAERLLALFKR
jgi:tetratricopeptide (TPR) repeat protein